MTYKPDPVLVFPDERVRYSYCQPCVPLVFELGVNLVESFVPTVKPMGDIPFFIRMRPKDSTPDDTRAYWPGPMNGRLSMERIRQLPRDQKLKAAPNFGKLALELDSLRFGVQRAVLDWIFPRFSIAAFFTIATIDPDKNGVFRIEASFGGSLLTQWDTEQTVRQNLLQRPEKAATKAAS